LCELGFFNYCRIKKRKDGGMEIKEKKFRKNSKLNHENVFFCFGRLLTL